VRLRVQKMVLLLSLALALIVTSQALAKERLFTVYNPNSYDAYVYVYASRTDVAADNPCAAPTVVGSNRQADITVDPDNPCAWITQIEVVVRDSANDVKDRFTIEKGGYKELEVMP